jgi:hypothetical protein
MPKLTIDFDTDEQSLSVKVNGHEVNSISGVSLYNWNYDTDKPKFVFEVSTSEVVDGVKKYSRLTASEKDGKPSEVFAGLFNAPALSQAQKDIVELMSKGRKL